MANTVQKVITCDADTGEIIAKREHRFTYWDENKGYLLWNQKANVRTFPDVDLPRDISKNDLGCLFLLCRKMLPTANLLVVRMRRGFKPMTLAEMQSVVDLKQTQFKTFMARMTRASMIRKVTIETGGRKEYQYYLNPVYFFSGKWLSLNLYLIWHDQIDAHLPLWIKDKYQESLKDSKQSAKKLSIKD